jgi:hypothetical protein
LGYEKRRDFHEYIDWIWHQEQRPDCVLIDGRFRVACFLTSLLNADVGTSIIFDDYNDRRHYHVVEEVVPKIKESGRQAIFVTHDLSMEQRRIAEDLLNQFRYVLD